MTHYCNACNRAMSEEEVETCPRKICIARNELARERAHNQREQWAREREEARRYTFAPDIYDAWRGYEL